MYSILVSCLLFIGQAHAANFNLLDATSFDPQPVVVQAKNNSVPIGTVIAWTKEEVPQGWLECDGQKVNKVLYPDLAALMPNTPNYKGMFLRGAGSQTLEHGAYGSVTHGTKLGEIQGDSIRNMQGGFNLFYGITNNHGVFGTRTQVVGVVAGHGAFLPYPVPQFDASRVVPTANENRPVNVGVKYIIKAE